MVDVDGGERAFCLECDREGQGRTFAFASEWSGSACPMEAVEQVAECE